MVEGRWAGWPDQAEDSQKKAKSRQCHEMKKTTVVLYELQTRFR